jgi:hypothetical protein
MALALVIAMANARSKGTGPIWEEVKGPIDLRSAGVRALAVDADDALYVEANLVEAAWLSRDAGSSWTPTPRRPRPSPGDAVVVEAVDPQGARWRSVRSSGIVTYPGSRPDISMTAPSIARRVERSVDGGKTWTVLRDDLEARAFAFDGHGGVWVAADGKGLFVVEGAELRWRQVLPNRTEAVVAAADRVVAATADAMLISVDGGAHFEVRDDGLGDGSSPRLRMQELATRALVRGPDGTVWAVGARRVCRLVPTTLRWKRLDAGMPDCMDEIEAFVLTRAGDAFLGTRFKGLFRLRERRER